MGYVSREPGVRYDRRRERFVAYYRDVEHAGFVDSQKVDMRAFDVWTTEGEGRMIWSATSNTPEPSSVQSARPEIIGLVMSELAGDRIIASER
jgi:hypothetical protein